MEITRHNYEEYFVLYIDNELNATERAAVEQFVNENPDLKSELEMFRDSVLPAGDVVAFADKSLLYKTESFSQHDLITIENCEEYFVLYADNELTNEENALVEQFVYKNPLQQENFELIQKIKYQPEKNIVFPDKSLLYRSSDDHKVVPMFARMRFWKMAAAAAVLVFICGTAWFALSNKSTGTDGSSNLAVNENTQTPAPRNKVQAQVAVTNEPGVPAADNKITEQAASLAQKSVTTPAVTIRIATGKREKSTPDVAEATGLGHKMYAANSVKKSSESSNISSPSSVKHISDGAEKVVEDKKQVIVPATSADQSLALAQNEKQVQPEQMAIGPVELKEGSAFASLANDNDEMFESSDKNKKMRGFFRKVTRVFDKATSKEPSENRKGLRIASFAIAL